MSEQALDLRRSLRIVRRHKIVVGAAAAIGVLAGAGYTALYPPLPSSNALVVLPPSVHDISTQVVIASSEPVLTNALRRLKPPVSLQTLRGQVQVKKLTANVVSISAEGKTATEAESTANAVANSYVAYLTAKNSATGKVQAKILALATNATGTSPRTQMIISGGLGALMGIVLGAILALAVNRGDRRLRQRDEIADALGVPVIASVPVSHPSDVAQWTRLLVSYEPSAADAWRLRTALHHLGLADVAAARAGRARGDSLGILSLSSDRRALALGPQLAVFAASLGIPTALVIDPHQDVNATAALRAACAAPASSLQRSGRLRVAVADSGGDDRLQGAALTVIVAVVDGRTPQVADTIRAGATLLAVTAGGATAEELARVASSSAADGRQIQGILVADPEPADHTTGRLPQLTRSAQGRSPSRMTGTVTVTKP